ncbi:polymorphic toxin-type HINT domain-containing protein [Kitasatospora sp. NPDC002227]|uniref:polymorphic toxin-type HINT domain-containing protein n=1 Tax=Kitasatospora sp. NPDC002227 TaxID=3154773 RepID=UPI0033300B95
MSVLTTLLVAPSVEAWAAARPHGKVWSPKTPLTSQKSVKGKDVKPGKLPAPKYQVPGEWKPSAPAAPVAAGAATVALPDAAPVQAGLLPVKVAQGDRDSVRSVRVEVSGAEKGKAAGVTGPVVALTDADTSSAKRSVKVALDLKTLQGAGWADRAKLVELPACALTTPDQAECQKQTPVASSVDPKTGVLTAQVSLAGASAPASAPVKSSLQDASGGHVVQASFVQAATASTATVLAATSTSSGPMGGYSASPLSPSMAWGAGANVGNFTYSYPVQTPPALGGPGASVGLAYDSSTVDGKTSAQNSQASWVGEGWDYQPGFIERSYRSCDKDGITGSGDQCWSGQNASLSLAGHSGRLVRDDTSGTWRLQGDDGSKVEQLTGAANEARGGEYWRVTTSDGVQYYFGQNHLPGGNHSDPATNSVEYAPVYSPKSGDDCYNSGTGNGSWCQEGWRWNLDYVVDPHQNLVTYSYQQDLNYYSRGGGQNGGSGTLTPYVRSAEVTQIAYGQRLPEQVAANGTVKPAAKVLFSTVERCTASGSVTCTTAQRVVANQSNWPDTPLDQACASTGTCTNYSPSFWSPLMLSQISTQVLVGSAYTTVDSWALNHSFPDPGDGTKPSLWLSSIVRTATNGQPAIALPAVSFTARELANRVDGMVPAEPAFNRPRIQQITTETGGKINVNYADPECSRVNNHMPSSEDGNSMACMPVHWYLPGSSSPDPVNDWFNKYLVTSVTEQDAVTGSTLVKATNYTYGGGAAWHRNDGEFTDPKVRTWDDFRGYQTVTTTTGSAFTGEAPKTQQVNTFLRGMNGDVLANGSTRSVSVSFTPYPGASAVTVTDDPWRSGTSLGGQTYDQAGGSVQSASSTVGSSDVVTATHHQQNSMPDLVARYGSTSTTTTAWSKLSNGTWRTVTSVATSDSAHANRPIQVDDKGDGTAATPETCDTTSYATSTNPLMLTLVSEDRSVVGACGTTPNATNTVKDNLTFYDGKAFGQAGATADVTSTQAIDSYDGSGNAHFTLLTTESFDVYGRPTTIAGPDGAATTTVFTPVTGALPTKSTITGPMGATWTTTQTFDPGRNLPLVSTDPNGRFTTKQYDALGRLTAVWQPDRATNLSANYKFSYAVNGVTGPSTVTSQAINEDGSYQTKNELYDGLGRLRQTQTTPATGGAGRLVTDQVYDSHGWVIKTAAPYYDAANQPNGTIYGPQDSQVPAQDWITYDGMGRKVTDAFMSYAQQQWVSTTAYPGADRVDATPPQGGAPTTTFTDARGRTTQRWQYHGSTPTGVAADADITTYGYTATGKPATRKDSSGNTWSYTYDLRDRQTSVTDPDSGISSTTYDVDSRVATTTDAKNNTLAYSYDVLGRKTGLYTGSVSTANQLAGWTYDSVASGKGQLASSTRYVGGASGKAYTQSVTGYDAMYRVLGTSVVIPGGTGGEGALANTYTTSNVYTPVLGSLDHTNLPAVGGLPAEEVDYLYSTTGLLMASGGNSTLVTDVQYDAVGRPTRTTVGDYGTQVVSTQQYDWATGRVTNSFLDRQTGTTSLDQTSYTYNPAGQITSVKDLQNASATDLQCFTYDYLGRVTTAWTDTAGTSTRSAPSVPGIGGCNNANGPTTAVPPSVGGPAPYWQSYGYDATGNRTSLVQHDVTGNTANDSTTTQTFNPAGTVNTTTNLPNTGGGTGGPHALMSTSTKSASGTAVTSYQYDQLGNTTKVTDTTGTVTLAWNGEDRLDSVTKSGQTPGTSYLYDADGNQLLRKDPGKTTLNLGADELTLDTSVPNGSMTDVRYYGSPGGISITRVTTATGGGSLVYQCADPHGTNGVQIGTDAAQTVTRRATDPFGNPRGTQPAAGSWSGDKGFVGGTKDDATGLTNLGAREYDPAHGRFLNPDPLLVEGDPQQWNGYAYSDNNPINSSDPAGTYPVADSSGGDSAAANRDAACSPFARSCNSGGGGGGGGGGDSTGCAGINYAPPCLPPATTTTNGAGSGGNTGKANTGNSRGTKKCGDWTSWDGLSCHTSNGLKRTQNFTTDHPVVREVIVSAAAFGTGLMCYGGGAAGAIETGGASAVAAVAGCGAAVGAVSSGLNNMLDGNADHSAKGQLAAEVNGAVQGASQAVMDMVAPEAALVAGGGCNSFPAGTLVLLADGTTKAIDQLTTNDEVTATDPQTGATAAKQIVATVVGHHDEEFTNLTLADVSAGSSPGSDEHATPGYLTVTQHHPFWEVKSHRWVDAADLKAGDQLRLPDGSTVTVGSVHNYTTAPQSAYNLTVDQLHTYYVLAGATPVLVHNGCPTQIPYNSTELGNMAYKARTAAGISTGRNVAVARVPGWNSPRTGDLVVGFSKGDGYHSENHIFDQLAAKGFNPSHITELYSERSPCDVCQPMLNEHLTPGTPVTYSVPHGPGSGDLLWALIQRVRGY